SATAPPATHGGAGSRAATCWRIDLRRRGAFGKKPHLSCGSGYDAQAAPEQSELLLTNIVTQPRKRDFVG
ncbi:hypothetical protein, partial [Xanthomonas translucens]